MLLRDARETDLDAIVELHTLARTAYYTAGGVPRAQLADPAEHAARRTDWARALRAADRVVLCAVPAAADCGTGAAAPVGVLSMGPPEHADIDGAVYGQLYQFHVAPQSWGLGAGSALHSAFVARLRAAGLSGGVLEAWENNTRAHGFYARRGWRPDGFSTPGPLRRDYLRMRLAVE